MSKVAEAFESMEYGPAPESPDRAFAWLESRDRRFSHYIGGEWVEGSGEERLDVRETPEFLQKVIPSAAYFEPERGIPDPLLGIYVVTPLRDVGDGTENTPGRIYNTSAHEGYPGHHLQLSWAARNPSPFRAVVSGDEFCEGWAHYAEELMDERGWRPVPGMRAAQLKDAMFRALRIQVDVDLQTGELDVERAVDLLIAEGRIPRERAEGEVAWYTTAPGYPLGYLTGKLLLEQLRRKTRAREGSGFDLSRFLADILAGGTMPVWAHARRLELLASTR